MLNDHAVLRACAHTKFIFVASGAGLAVTLVLVPILTLTLGLPGAALGLVAGVATMRTIGVARVAGLLQLRLPTVLPWAQMARYLAGSMLAAAVVFP